MNTTEKRKIGQFAESVNHTTLVMEWLHCAIDYPDIERLILCIWFQIPSRIVGLGFCISTSRRVSIGNDMWAGRNWGSVFTGWSKFMGIVQLDRKTGNWLQLTSNESDKICVCNGKHLTEISDTVIKEYAMRTRYRPYLYDPTDRFDCINGNAADKYGCEYCYDIASGKFNSNMHQPLTMWYTS